MIKSLNFLTMFFVVNVLTAGPNVVRKVRETDSRKVRVTETNIILKVHSVSVTGGSVVITGEIASGSQSQYTQTTYSNDAVGASVDVGGALDLRGIVSVASNPKKKDADGCVSLAMQAAALGKSISISDVAEEQIYPFSTKVLQRPIARLSDSGIDHYLDNLSGCTLSFK